MSEPENPFLHPARARFLDLLDETERLDLEKAQDQPMHDPLARYHLATDWGVDPWVLRAIELDQHIDLLRAEARSFTFDADGKVPDALKEAAVAALQALVLFEEQANGDPELDDQEMASFLEKLNNKLALRIDADLRQPDEDPSADPDFPGADDDHTKHVHVALGWEHGSPPTPDEGPPMDKDVHDDDHTKHVPFAFDHKATFDADDDLPPGLAFAAPHGSVVAGEGNDGTPAYTDQSMAQWEHPADEQFVLQPRLVPDQPEEVPADTGAHDFRPPEPVDLDAAERAHAREIIHLRTSAAGSSASQLGGRHQSPDDTQPDLGETGRRAKEG